MSLAPFAFILLQAAVGPQGPAKSPPVFSVAVENVYIDAFVSHRGAPVSGLLASQRAADKIDTRTPGMVSTLRIIHYYTNYNPS